MAPLEQVRAFAGGGSARIHDPEIASNGRAKRGQEIERRRAASRGVGAQDRAYRAGRSGPTRWDNQQQRA
jgi:hypothetical protein